MRTYPVSLTLLPARTFTFTCTQEGVAPTGPPTDTGPALPRGSYAAAATPLRPKRASGAGSGDDLAALNAVLSLEGKVEHLLATFEVGGGGAQGARRCCDCLHLPLILALVRQDQSCLAMWLARCWPRLICA